MKSAPIVPARIEWAGDAPPFAPEFGDLYHAGAGAIGQAEHVFLRGNGLPRRWAGRRRFVVLETGFGLGRNFLATWAAWRDDPARCDRLHFIAVELHPPRRDDLARGAAAVPLAGLAEQLVAAWPPLTFGMHRLVFDGGRVELLLAFGEAAAWLRAIEAEVDAFFLDGFAPACNPAMWSPSVFAALPGRAAEGATAATWSAAREVREGLARAGFEVERTPGFAGKRDMTVAHFAPRHRPQRSPRRQSALPGAGAALVIGAGLAGGATAAALAEQGLVVTVIDQAPQPAAAASGNPAGLFRSAAHRDDSLHARWHRAAALEAARVCRALTAAGTIAGACDGVLQPGIDGVEASALLRRLAWPPELIEALDPSRAARCSGLPSDTWAWRFAAAGWLSPVQLVRHWLQSSGARLVLGTRVASLRKVGGQWQALDESGGVIAAAPVAVLANAASAADLAPWAAWPLQRSRGQVTLVPQGTPGLRVPRVPLASGGYVLALPGGDVLCGATAAIDDDEPGLREADHRHNLQILQRLTGQGVECPAPRLGGRVGWRCRTPDRLPVIGAVPADASLGPAPSRLDQPRLVPRSSGLFAFTALGSRGITSAALGARVLAGCITGAPMPVESCLLDALDPARFIAREARQSPSLAG